MNHPFRFYFRDFDLQGQETELLVLRFADGSLNLDLGTHAPLLRTLSTVLAAKSSLLFTQDYRVVDGVSALEFTYERDDDGELDYGSFDRQVDAVLLGIHAQLPLAEVIHVGGNHSGDAWERWSLQQAPPTPTALTLVLSERGHTQPVDAPVEHDGPMPSPIELKRGSLASAVALANEVRQTAGTSTPAPPGPRPAGLGLARVNEDGVLWPDRISHDSLQVLVDAGSDTAWVLASRTRPRFGGGFVTTLKCEDPARSWARELAWTDAANLHVTRTAVATQQVYVGEQRIACLSLGSVCVIDPATGQVDTYPRYEGPLAALLPFADGVLARTTNARKKDIVALLNVVDGAIRVAGEVEVNCDGLVAVPELPVAIGYTDRGLWCIAWHAGALHLSAKMSVRAESVATHGGVVRVRDDKGGVHEVCGISAWVSSLG